MTDVHAMKWTIVTSCQFWPSCQASGGSLQRHICCTLKFQGDERNCRGKAVQRIKNLVQNSDFIPNSKNLSCSSQPPNIILKLFRTFSTVLPLPTDHKVAEGVMFGFTGKYISDKYILKIHILQHTGPYIDHFSCLLLLLQDVHSAQYLDSDSGQPDASMVHEGSSCFYHPFFPVAVSRGRSLNLEVAPSQRPVIPVTTDRTLLHKVA